MSRTDWLIVSAVWLVCAFGSGAALAWLYRRLHPALSFHKLWAFWTAVLSLAIAALFGLGWL